MSMLNVQKKRWSFSASHYGELDVGKYSLNVASAEVSVANLLHIYSYFRRT